VVGELGNAVRGRRGCDQSFEEFLAGGPVDRAIPPEALEELSAAVRKLIAQRDVQL
jgi:hypothetical protein